jgi:hypothetical protein
LTLPDSILPTGEKFMPLRHKQCSAALAIVAGAALAFSSLTVTPALADPPGTTARVGHIGGSVYVHFAAAPPAGSTVICIWNGNIADQYSTNFSFTATATISNQLAVCGFNNVYRVALATPASDLLGSTLTVYFMPSSTTNFFQPSTWNQQLGAVALPPNDAWTVLSSDVYF